MTAKRFRNINNRSLIVFCVDDRNKLLNKYTSGHSLRRHDAHLMSLKCDYCLCIYVLIWNETVFSWWRHQMVTFSALLAICAGNSPVSGEFPAQTPVTRSFDIFVDLRLNKRLSKQLLGWWFETLPRPLWCHSTVISMSSIWRVRTYVCMFYSLAEPLISLGRWSKAIFRKPFPIFNNLGCRYLAPDDLHFNFIYAWPLIWSFSQGNIIPIMTSSSGNVFCVTGPLCGEFTGHRWIPLTRANDAKLSCFLLSVPEQMTEQTTKTPVIWDAIAFITMSL